MDERTNAKGPGSEYLADTQQPAGQESASIRERALKWGKEFGTHFAAIEESQDLKDAPDRDVRIANAKRNLMRDTLREIGARLDISETYIQEKMGGISRDDLKDEMEMLRRKLTDHSSRVDPNEQVSKRPGPGPAPFPWEKTQETAVDPRPMAATPHESTVDMLNGCHQMVGMLEEDLGAVLLPDPSVEHPNDRCMSHINEMIAGLRKRLATLVQRIDL
ncbi:MAG: hypothetical protein ACW99G_01505 [Candidatus Thorarchaeota archaeon]|jgi:hypothetical protein